MRNAFINTLFEIADSDPRINLMVGDLGYSVVEKFAEKYPDRFLNAGVAEQNMAGMAAGMALTDGSTVFIYSIANFPILRCLEQVRNDICYHKANVKIISVGGGVAYGSLGYTHYGVEDLSIMSSLPGIVVAAPADPAEAGEIARLACNSYGPWYIRLGKNGEPLIHDKLPRQDRPGAAIWLREGKLGTIIATGAVAAEAVEAAAILERDYGLQFGIISLPFIKPFDKSAVLQAASETGVIITVEEHSGEGALASATGRTIAEAGICLKFSSLRLPEFLYDIGSQDYLRKLYGIDSESIAKEAVALVG